MKRIFLIALAIGGFLLTAFFVFYAVPTSIKHHTIDLEGDYYLRKKLSDGFVDLRHSGRTLLSRVIHFRVSPGYVYGWHLSDEHGKRYFILQVKDATLKTFEARSEFKSQVKSRNLAPMDMATDYTFETIAMGLEEGDENLAWPRWREKPSN